MSTPSLGDLLRQAIDRNIVAEEQKRQAKLAEEQSQSEREEKLVRELFETAKQVFTSAIIAGNEIVPICVGKGQNVSVSNLTNSFNGDIDRPRHQYFSFWKDFSDWADSQGLEASWSYQQDGFGMADWRLLSVRPLSNPANV